MKVMKKYRLVAEDRYSIGRYAAILSIVFQIFGLYVVNDSLSNGSFYGDGTWVFALFYYLFLWVILVGGLYWHSRVKWPEFEEELYDDGWIRYRFYGHGRYSDTDTWIPVEYIARISKYKKKYSRRKKNWYVWFTMDLLYEGQEYIIITYGWLEEPKSIEEFEEYVELIKKQIEKNTIGKEMKIKFTMNVKDVDDWAELGFIRKASEERNREIEQGEEL